MGLLELSQKAKKINIRKLALQVAKANSGLITDNIKSQLETGMAGDGREVGRYANTVYSLFKQRIGTKASFGVVDLKVSGNLYNGLNTVIEGNSVTTDSSVNYSIFQIGRYGKRVYENTEENKKIVKLANSKEIVSEYTKLLGL